MQSGISIVIGEVESRHVEEEAAWSPQELGGRDCMSRERRRDLLGNYQCPWNSLILSVAGCSDARYCGS